MAPKNDIPGRIWITLLVFLTFAFGMIGMAAATGWREALEAIQKISIWQFALLLGLSLINYGFRGIRWHVYTSAIGIPTRFPADMRHYLGGFALTATPGRVGELIRLRWIWRETGRRPDSTASIVLADRAGDLAAVGLLLAMSIAASAAGLAGAWTAAFLAVLLALLATRPELMRFGITMGWKCLGTFPRLFAGLRRATGGLKTFSKASVFMPGTGLGMVGWCAEAYAFFLLLQWLGADVGLATAFAIFFFSMLTGGATGLPGGIGGAEAAMVAALALNDVPFEIALPATAIIRLTTLWFAILVGVGVFPFAERHAAVSDKGAE